MSSSSSSRFSAGVILAVTSGVCPFRAGSKAPVKLEGSLLGADTHADVEIAVRAEQGFVQHPRKKVADRGTEQYVGGVVLSTLDPGPGGSRRLGVIA